MATEQELKDSAAAHAKKTQYAWRMFLERVHNDPNYNYSNTEWAFAGDDLEEIKHLPPTPIPPPPNQHILAQNLLFVTDGIDRALRVDHKFTLLLSADPRYRAWERGEWIRRARGLGYRLGTWCDCRTTFPDVAKELAAHYKFDTWCGQAEDERQLMIAMDAQAPLIVGNANNLSQFQRDYLTGSIMEGKTSFTQEAYTNATGVWPNATSAGGVPAASLCIALYDASSESDIGRYITVDEYRLHSQPSVWAGISCYDGGARPGEIEKL